MGNTGLAISHNATCTDKVVNILGYKQAFGLISQFHPSLEHRAENDDTCVPTVNDETLRVDR